MDWGRVPEFLFADIHKRPAQVLRVLDGDTCVVGIHIRPDWPAKVTVRLHGIDTPEIHGKHCPAYHQLACAARDRLQELVGNKTILLTIHSWDKYGGRVIGTIYTDPEQVDVCALMLQEKYAVPYTGRTCKKTDAQMLAACRHGQGARPTQ